MTKCKLFQRFFFYSTYTDFIMSKFYKLLLCDLVQNIIEHPNHKNDHTINSNYLYGTWSIQSSFLYIIFMYIRKKKTTTTFVDTKEDLICNWFFKSLSFFAIMGSLSIDARVLKKICNCFVIRFIEVQWLTDHLIVWSSDLQNV